MRSLIALLWFLGVNPPGLAQTQLNLRHFMVEDGLSQGSVNAILQDHKGFLWIGTHDGLNRFDGTEFKVFRHHTDDTTSLSSSWIFSLFEDRSGTLWVKTERGLDRFDRATASFVRVPNAPGDIGCLSQSDTAVTFWVTGKPVSLFNTRAGTTHSISVHFKNGSEVKEGGLSVLAEGVDGHLWAATATTVYRIDIRRGLVVSSFETNKNVIAILPSRRQRDVAWIGTTTGVIRISGGRQQFLGKLSTQVLTEDSEGTIWAGTVDGLVRFDPLDSLGTSATVFRHDPAVSTTLRHNIVTGIFEDLSGSLWIGTYNGLSLFDKFSPAFSVYRSSPDNPRSLGDNFVMPIVEDRTGNIWFGTFAAGVSILHRSGERAGTFTHLRYDPRNPKSLRSNNVRSMLCARDGRIWIGTTRGVTIYDPATENMSVVFSSTERDSQIYWIESMCESRDGSVWMPVNGKLFNVSPSGHTRRKYQIPGQAIVNITEDADGIVWLASVGNGVLRLEPRTGIVTTYAHVPGDPASLSNNNVWGILSNPDDTSGTLWIGTSNGLNRLNTQSGKCSRYFAQEGFPNSWVYGILRDDEGRLWMSTNYGLVQFDDRMPDGKKFKSYTYADGIAGNEFNRRSYVRLRNGEFLFGGPNGVTRFHPSGVQENPVVPPLVLTGFERFGKRVLFDRDIADVSSMDFNHDENVFSFEFVALNFSNPSENRYAYMMEGIDEDWIDAGPRRLVNYAYVSPGSYVFRVKASHNSGVWNENEIAVNINIRPPFWMTWWFIALCAGMAAALVAYAVRARVRRLLEMERMRSRIARDLHDEIGSNLSSIAMASDLLGRHPGFGERERGKLSDISSVALNTVKDMKDIVWLIDPGNDSLDDLFLRMKDTAASLLEGHHLTLNFPAAANGKRVNLEWKRNLYFIYKETLTNILKHAQAANVRVDVQVEKDQLLVEIHDDGKGLDLQTVRRGNGLKNIRERAGLLDAAVDVSVGPAGGTRMSLKARIT